MKNGESKFSENEFWRLIEESKAVQKNDHYQKYVENLSKLGNEELESFNRLHVWFKRKAGTSRTSEAVYIVTNGLGDDDFENFLAGVVAQGQAFYSDFLKDPESALLAIEDPASLEKYEQFDFAHHQIYEARVGSDDLPYDFKEYWDELSDLDDYSEDPANLQKRFPKLFAKFWKIVM